MLSRVDLLLGEVLARIDLRQAAILVISVVALLAILLLIGIGGDEAVEADDGTDGAQASLLAVVVGNDFSRRTFDFGRCHLAGDTALPDQIVETDLVGIQELADAIR